MEPTTARRIESLVTTDGHLRDAPLTFAPGLNCIIGARGTCKSTIVETLRFLFNHDEQRVQELLSPGGGAGRDDGVSHQGLIAATLRGGTARITLAEEPQADGGSAIVVERDTVSASRAYVDGIKSVSDGSLLDAIEIYSQGELQEVALSSAKRLALIDRPHQAEIDRARTRAHELASEIAALGPRIRNLRESVDAGQRAVVEGEPLRAQLDAQRAQRPSLSSDLTAMRAAYQSAERAISDATRLVETAEQDRVLFEAAVQQLQSTTAAAHRVDVPGDGPLSVIVREIAARAEAAALATRGFAPDSELRDALARARTDLEANSGPYFEARKLEEAANDALRQEDRLSEEVARLDRIADELREHQSEVRHLEEERARLRADLAAIRNEVFHWRLREVDRLNAQFSERIILSLSHGSRTDGYREALDELLGGSRLRDQPALCRQLASVLPPSEFVGLVEKEDAAALARLLNREEGQMLRLISHVAGDDALYALERDVSEDELDITMFVDGQPRSVGEMSKGQKATAILPLLLRDAPYPLVLDQPEDDLDNRFIYDRLVKSIADLKTTRQLIFVTHNANIPVVGGADRVFVMAMADPDHATVTAQGSVDEVKAEILLLLEGGREAFERRGTTYGLGPK